jgi:hypothetical protein
MLNGIELSVMKYSLRQGYDKRVALLVFHTQAGLQAYAQLQRLPLWTDKFQCIDLG